MIINFVLKNAGDLVKQHESLPISGALIDKKILNCIPINTTLHTRPPQTIMASTSDAPASCKVVLANNIAKNLLLEVNGGLQKLPTPPHLVGFLANADPAARMYAEWTQKTCKEK
jgi:hypothetical protein